VDPKGQPDITEELKSLAKSGEWFCCHKNLGTCIGAANYKVNRWEYLSPRYEYGVVLNLTERTTTKIEGCLVHIGSKDGFVGCGY
jgi:hypothetical protein